MVHANSKFTFSLSSKITFYVPHISSVIFKLPVPEINDCVFGKELIKLERNVGIYVLEIHLYGCYA